MEEIQKKKSIITRVRESATFKVFAIGFLVLILLVPASMVTSVIRERKQRMESVLDEIGSKWGQAQTITGPVITIPYKQYYEKEKGQKISVTQYAHILPERLDVQGNIVPEIRYRGIYETVVYNTALKLSGEFIAPDFEKLGVPDKQVLWDRAFIAVGIPDMRGVRENISAVINELPTVMNPGVETKDVIATGISAPIKLTRKNSTVSFNIGIDLNGSRHLYFVPVGKITTVQLSSKWESPSFDGSFLPSERKIGKDGFSAKWKVLHLNRNYPQSWVGPCPPQMQASAFGVRLLIPADAHQKAVRTTKYAVMFLGLTFLAFFFSEVMMRIRIHPIQYILIGLALIIFYSLLISISEHIGFGKGYLISSVATVLLIGGYARSVLRKRALAGLVTVILAVLYAYLYILLQLEDFALLLGSIGLFVVLAVVMYMTRKIDWYTAGSD